MRLLAELPPDRETEGRFYIFDDAGSVILGPRRCRGEADNAGAAAHSNALEDPTKSFGDHPFGVSRVNALVQDPRPVESYGPFFVTLIPLEGEALEGWREGRRGIGIHGGKLGPDGLLRATYGCLRLDNETLEQAVRLIKPELDAERRVFYTCRPLTP